MRLRNKAPLAALGVAVALFAGGVGAQVLLPSQPGPTLGDRGVGSGSDLLLVDPRTGRATLTPREGDQNRLLSPRENPFGMELLTVPEPSPAQEDPNSERGEVFQLDPGTIELLQRATEDARRGEALADAVLSGELGIGRKESWFGSVKGRREIDEPFKEYLENTLSDQPSFVIRRILAPEPDPEVNAAKALSLDLARQLDMPPVISLHDLSDEEVREAERLYQDLLGGPDGEGPLVRLLPHTEDEDQKIIIGRGENGGLFSVGPGAGPTGPYVPGLAPGAPSTGGAGGSAALPEDAAPADRRAFADALRNLTRNGVDAGAVAPCGVEGGAPCLHAVVALHDKRQVYCSGIAVAPTWILTAAHCVCQKQDFLVTAGGAAKLDFQLPVGPDFTTFTTDSRPRFFGGAEPGDDQGFCGLYDTWRAHLKAGRKEDARQLSVELFALGDLALIELSAPLSLPGARSVAQLVAADLLPSVARVRAAGFGANNWQEHGGVKTGFEAIYDGSACAPAGIANPCLPERELALTRIDGTDTCSGDSGGGLMLSTSDGGEAVIAITSRALFGGGCGKGGIYARVADESVIDWVRDVIGDLDVIEDRAELAAFQLRMTN